MNLMQSLQRNKQQSKKHRLFYLHHQILKYYTISNKLYGILLLIQTLQIIQYAIHPTFTGLWPLQILQIIQKIFQFIQFNGIWRNIGGIALFTYIIIIFLLYSINICFILYEIFKTQYKSKQPNMLAYKYISNIGIFTKTILFIPTVNACLSFIMANTNAERAIQIPDELYGVVTVLSIFTLILLLINSINFIIFLRENNPFSKLPFVGSVNQNEQIRCLIKFIISVYGAIIVQKSSIGRIFCILLLLFNIFYLVKLYYSARMLIFPYNILTQLAPCITTWFCVCTLLQQFIYQDQTIGLLFLLLGIFIIPFVWVQINQRYRDQILYSNYKFITSPEELLYYNYQCLNLVNNLHEKRSLIYLQGILNYHISQCKKSIQSCGCIKIRQRMSRYKLQSEKSQILQQKQLWYTFIKSNLSDIKQKYKYVPEISMLLSYIERDQLSNKFKALHNLQQPSHFNSGWKFEFLNYHYLRQIQERMFNQDRLANQKKSVDVNKFIEFQNNFGKLEKAIEQSTYAHLHFWSNLASQRASKQKLISDGKAINKKVLQTKFLYEKLIEINPSNLHCLIIYANYMKIIVNNPQIYQKSNQSIKIIKRNLLNSSKLNNDPQKQKYADNAVTGVIIISGQRSNIGVIKHCNSKITQLIKYSPHEILGQNINILMPKFIGNMHDDILMSYLQLSQSKHDNNQRMAPMIDKDNYLVFARILTKPLPSLFNGLELIGLFNLVTQSHMDHPGEIPKYVLYRTDSGQVQALSESCDNQYNYRINKIDQNHQTSSEITFSSLFYGIKDSQLSLVDKAVKSNVKMISEENQTNQVPVDVYLRHQIYYFGVKLKLLYFFTIRSYKKFGDSFDKQFQMNNNGGVFKKIMIQQQQAEGIKNNAEAEISASIAKEKKIRQLMRKKNNSQYQPLSLKILSRFGYISLILISIVILILLFLDLSGFSFLQDFLQFSRINLQTQSEIIQINYYSRLKHLSYYYPDKLKQFNLYSKNISILSSKLQQKQFQLVQYVLKSQSNGLSYIPYVLSWTINQNLIISSSKTTLDVNIFDYITSSSHFQSSKQSQLTFPLQMTLSPINQPRFIQLFHLRYTGLFQSIPNKIIFHENSLNYFNKLQINRINNQSVQLAVIIVILCIILAILIPLLMCLQNYVNQTVMLFGYMNIYQIQKQSDNCNFFLEIFFKDSYQVILNNKKKLQIQNNKNIFNNEQKITKQKSKPHSNVNNTQKRNKNKTSSLMINETQVQLKGRRGSILQNTQKIQALQIAFQQKTSHQLQQLSNLNNDEQQKEQFIKPSYDQDQSIYEKLSKTKDNSKFYYILIYVFLIGIFIAYFVIRFQINQNFINQQHQNIKKFRMVSQNLNLMKKVKLYSIQSIIDNTKFKNYRLLNQTAINYVTKLYQHQRHYNQYIYPVSLQLTNIYGNQKINEIIKSSLCDQIYISLYLSIQQSNKIYPKNSYSTQQCQLIQNGILIQGLRPSIIAFTEILYNLTKNPHTVDQMMQSVKFLSIIKMQKYIQAAQVFFIEKLYKNIHLSVSNFHNLEIALSIIMFLVTILLIILVWWPLMRGLVLKISSSSQILGLIPVRVFIKNAKLAKQYQNFINQMVQ